MRPFGLIAYGLAGLIFGSFLTVVVHRVPRRRSVVTPRSSCPECGAPILARDNVPVVSYLALRGRCRHCGARISPWYPLTELATAGLFIGSALTFADRFVAALIAVFSGLMLALALIDLEHRILPNAVVYPATALFAVALAIGSIADHEVDPLRGLLGLLAFGGFMFVIAVISPAGMGMGDVKLAALIGLVLGSLGFRYVEVAAGLAILGGGLGAVVALAAGRSRKSTIAFGPYLAAAAVVAAFWGPPIAHAYLSRLA